MPSVGDYNSRENPTYQVFGADHPYNQPTPLGMVARSNGPIDPDAAIGAGGVLYSKYSDLILKAVQGGFAYFDFSGNRVADVKDPGVSPSHATSHSFLDSVVAAVPFLAPVAAAATTVVAVVKSAEQKSPIIQKSVETVSTGGLNISTDLVKKEVPIGLQATASKLTLGLTKDVQNTASLTTDLQRGDSVHNDLKSAAIVSAVVATAGASAAAGATGLETLALAAAADQSSKNLLAGKTNKGLQGAANILGLGQEYQDFVAPFLSPAPAGTTRPSPTPSSYPVGTSSPLATVAVSNPFYSSDGVPVSVGGISIFVILGAGLLVLAIKKYKDGHI